MCTIFSPNGLTNVYEGCIMSAVNKSGHRKEKKMISRKELESYGVIMTDEQWKENQRLMAEMQEQMWNEDHPMDE